MATEQRAAAEHAAPTQVWRDEGVFPQACELCGDRPTVVRVGTIETDPEAAQKLGESGMVRFWWYCARHRDVAGNLYDDFWDQSQSQSQSRS
jgi:hypothetical protein